MDYLVVYYEDDHKAGVHTQRGKSTYSNVYRREAAESNLLSNPSCVTWIYSAEHCFNYMISARNCVRNYSMQVSMKTAQSLSCLHDFILAIRKLEAFYFIR